VAFNSCPPESTLSGGEVQCSFENSEIVDNNMGLLALLLGHNTHLVASKKTGKGQVTSRHTLFGLSATAPLLAKSLA